MVTPLWLGGVGSRHEAAEPASWLTAALRFGDLFQACRLLADLADDVLLEEIRQRGAAAQGRFPRWHRRRSRGGLLLPQPLQTDLAFVIRCC